MFSCTFLSPLLPFVVPVMSTYLHLAFADPCALPAMADEPQDHLLNDVVIQDNAVEIPLNQLKNMW